MPAVKLSLNARYNRPLREMAKEYGISFSDLMNEIAEWVLDQEEDFRIDLEASLGIEESEEDEDEDEDLDEDEEDEG